MKKTLRFMTFGIVLCSGIMLSAKPFYSKPKSGKNCQLSLFPAAVFSPGKWNALKKDKKRIIEFSFPEEKTPTGKSCIKIEFKNKGGGDKANSPMLEKTGLWRNEKYGEVSFWAKAASDCKNRKVIFKVFCKSGQYVWTFMPEPDKWKKFSFPVSAATTKSGDRKDLNTINLCGFVSHNPVSFKVGDFSMEPAAQKLPVKIEKAIIIPEIKGEPVKLDGSLDETVWNKAYKVDNFVLAQKGAAAKEKTELRIFADEKNLYVGARMFDEDTSKMKAAQKKRDVSVYTDDCFEVMVDDNLDAKSYKHFVLNSIGTIQEYQWRFDQTAEAFIQDKEWNPKWFHKSRISPKEWSVEVALPLEVLGVSPGKPFAIQVGRENHSIKEYSSMKFTDRKFTDVRNYAFAAIGNKNVSISGLALKMDKPGSFILNGKAEKGNIDFDLNIADPYGNVQKEKLTATTDSSGAFSVPFKLKTPADGAYFISICGKSGNESILPEALSFYLRLPAEIAYGDIFLNPTPKKISFPKGRFSFDAKTPIVISAEASKRTRKTARFLRREVQHGLFNFLPSITDEAVSQKHFEVVLREHAKGLDEETAKAVSELPKEGYFLDVSPEKVMIVGADEPGLYYGVVTFIQLMRANLVKKHEPSLGCARVFDWSDLPFRGVVHGVISYRRYKEPRYDLEDLKKYVKEVIAGSKMNFYSPHFHISFEYDKHSCLTSVRGIMKKEDYSELARFCKEHFVEFIPALQSGGHSDNFIRNFPEVKEPGFNRQVNVTHEKWRDIIFNCYKDILDAVPDAKYFMIWHDEWWGRGSIEKTDEFQGKKRWKIFADDVIASYKFFKKRGIKTMMFCDMLLKEHNGGYPMNVSKALEVLPRDIIMCNWSLRTAPDGTARMHEMGFTVFDIVNQFRTVPAQDVNIISGFGSIIYTWFRQTFTYRSPDNIMPDYTHAPYRAAQYSWNIKSESHLPLGEWRRRYMNNLQSLYNFPARRAERLRWKAKDIDKRANVNLSEWFDAPKLAPLCPAGKQTFAFIPFIIPEGKALAPVPGTEEIAIDINSPLKSLAFLQGAYLPKEKRKDFKKRSLKYLTGVPLGEVRVEYEDGPSEIIPLLMGINTNEFTPFPSSRFMYGVRYTYDTETKNGQKAALYLLEWTNPWHFRKVKRVVWKGYGLEASPVLFGISIGL